MTAAPDINDRQNVLKRALMEIRELRQALQTLEQERVEPIAIVGMACRMPGGANDPASFWELLRSGKDATREVPPGRFDMGAFYDGTRDTPGKSYTRRGGFLDDVEGFDAQFFGISPREATYLDPQQRLFLEACWEALEDAGQAPDRLVGSPTGVFVGVTNYDYCQSMMQRMRPAELDAYCLTSNASTFAAGRLSYWLGLQGPSLSVDTACSSSLVAVHLACQSLRSGECSMALAGGVNVLLSPEWFVVLSQAHMVAPDGRCKTFDKSANGYARGEGCGVVVLKRLSDALASHDRIYAVVRGSAVNQDGRSSGITVPNAQAQQSVIRQALRAARLEPSAVGYVETHGTGTPLGDPIEVRALSAVLGEGRPAGERLAIGSVKTNIGHLEPAAGVAGLIKTALALHHGELPPHLHLRELNPEISLEELPITIPTQVTPWPRNGHPRVAGVSSFGASGTNAHLILEAAPERSRVTAPVERPLHLLTLSARSGEALAELARRYAGHLAAQPEVSLADACFTANHGRAHFNHRLAVVGGTVAQVKERLTAFAAGSAPEDVRVGRVASGSRTKVAFLFTGQGSQYAGMGRALYEAQPVFRRTLERCDALLRPYLEQPLLSVLFPEEGAPALLDETAYTQPALFALEYALAELWRSWGVEPAAVMGHSVGEYVAACVAGVLGLEEALALIARRGRLMQALPRGGAMATLFASPERVARALQPHARALSIAAVNGPESVVVSGVKAELDALLARLEAEGVRSRPLTVSHAFHSPLVEPMLDAFEQEASRLTYAAPRIPIVSNLTGRLAERGTFNARYFREHARAPVQFAGSVELLVAQGFRAFVEVGPAPMLLGMAKRFVAEPAVSWLPSLRKGSDAWQTLLQSLGALYTQGVDVDWAGFDRDYPRRRVTLPTYAFQRKRYWLPEVKPGAAPAAAQAATPAPTLPAGPRPLLGRRIPSPLDVTQLEARLDAAVHPCLGDCVMDGLPVVNIGFYLEAALEAGRALEGGDALCVEDVLVLQGLILPPEEQRTAQAHVEPPGEDGRAAFRFYSLEPTDGAWRLHVQGLLRAGGASPAPVDVEAVRARCQAEVSGAAFYQSMWRRRLYLGPSAQWVERVLRRDGEALVWMRAPRDGEAEAYLLHPGLVDASLQALFACLPDQVPPTAIYMLVGIERFSFHGHGGGPLLCHAALREGPDVAQSLAADVTLLTPEGRVVAHLAGAHLKRATREALVQATSATARPPRPTAPRAASARPVAGPASAPERRGGVLERLRGAASRAEALEVLRAFVTGKVAAVLGGAAADVDTGESLQNMGLDSLMALELKNGLASELGVELPLVSFLDGPSVDRLVEQLHPRLEQVLPRGTPAQRDGDVEVRAQPPASVETPAAGVVPAAALVPQRAARHEPFPLTDLQQAYLVGRTGAFELGNVSTYFFLEVDLEGLELARFTATLRQLIDRHDMLRAVMTPDGQQRVLPDVPPYTVAATDLRGQPAEAVDAALEATRREMAGLVFDTGRWPLFEVRASLLDGGRTRIHIGLDALIIDAWSTSLLFREWSQLYREPGAALPPLDITFRDYVLGVRALEGGEAYQRALAYWQQRLPSLPPAPELPLAKNPASVPRPRFAHRSGRLSPELWTRLRKRAQELGVTPSAAVCAAYAEVLAAWSRSHRFTLNVLFFNRLPLHPQVKDVLGNFSATSLLEVDSTPAEPFDVRARRVQKQLWSDLEHSQVSGVRVLRELNRQQGNSSRAGMPVVFASTINFGAREKERDTPAGLTQHLLQMGGGGREVHSSIRTPQVWLDHQVVEDGGGLVFNWDVVEELFPEGLVDAMFAAYEALLRRLASREEAWQESRRLHVPDAQLELRRRVNATAAPVPEGLLHEPFMRAVAAHAERPAVITSGRTLTYAELDVLSNRLGHWLRERGARPDMRVGVVMEKGWEQVAAVLGVLKSGAAYVPIDAGVPQERLEYLLRHAEVELVLTQARVESRIQWPEGLRQLAVDGEQVAALSAAPLEPVQRPEDLAYIIYTSGSTGMPKGVMIEHRSALNTVVDVNQRFGVGSEDRVLGLSALNFDLSVYDVFGLLAVGGAVVLPDASISREPARWVELMAQARVTVWNTVPALMEMLADHAASSAEGDPAREVLAALRVVMMSGDWIPVSLPDRIRAVAPQARVYSLGGATEAAIWSIYYPIHRVDPSWASIPYGMPMLNQQFHVLDGALQPCPVWAPGQLYIGGVGVARGYLNDAERTSASFIRHPLTGERLYRTGDLGRYLPDGNIEFLGREDFQVKVQGYRIELGEIEVALSQQPGVRAAVVAAVGERRGSKRLVAYVVLEPDSPPSHEALREALRRKLPEYAVPQVYISLDALPLSANGKVDRKALPDPTESRSARERVHTPPRDEVEQRLASIWQELLEARPIGVEDGFFDLGGHSLLAVRMMASIRKHFGRELPLAMLFERPTISRLAEVLRDGPGVNRREPLVPIQPGGHRPPLFFVHPVGGDVLCYSELARALGTDQPLYGLQVPDFGPDEVPHACLEDMASAYVKALRAVQPAGPYRLGGWSMGGMLAFEMARQLQAAGEAVALLALVDVIEPPGPARELPDAALLLSWFARDLGGLAGRALALSPEVLRGLAAREQLEHLLEHARQQAVLPPDMDAPTLERFVETFQRNFRALLSYAPDRFDGDVLYVRASAGATMRTAEAWRQKVLGTMTVVELAGDHYTVVREPAVHTLAGVLRERLEVVR
jgi:amino acid adenylation domain-containing protein